MHPAGDPAIASWVAERPTSSLFLTAVTEAELRFGLAIMPAGKRRDGLTAGLERMLGTGFANRVLPFDSGAARAYAGIAAARRRMGPTDLAGGRSDHGDRALPGHGGGNTQHSRFRRHGDRRDRPLGWRVSSFRSNTASATKSGAPLAAALRDAGRHWRGRWRRRSAARPCVICKSLIVPRTRAGAEPGLGSRLRRRVRRQRADRARRPREQLLRATRRKLPGARVSPASARQEIVHIDEAGRALSRPDCRQDRALEAELHAGPRRRGVQRFSSRLHGATAGTAAGAAR